MQVQKVVQLSDLKQKVIQYMNGVAPKRDKWINKNKYYYKSLSGFLRFNVPEGSRVLEIGCGTGYLLNQLNPRRGVGIDLSPQMTALARQHYPQHEFLTMDAEQLELEEKFDF